MPTGTVRPDHLPEYQNPPLTEVVIGVQFVTPRVYQQIRAGEVWSLFKDQFPNVQEHQALAPTFETFGLPVLGPRRLQLLSGASHDRFWFLSEGGEELIQFQQDRLLHNWRKVGDESNEYPRFETMVKRFERELGLLDDYFKSLSSQDLQITQCEITYINHIEIAPEGHLGAEQWLRFLSFEKEIQPEDFSVTFRRNVVDDGGKPTGRLISEATVGFKADKRPIIALTLTVRGAPKEASIRSALEFISRGRELIVTQFTQMTTDQAHKVWGRAK
jgi:uncharacterized protein (TIGR04255 family)